MVLISGLVIAFAVFILNPQNIPVLPSHPRPAQSYTGAMQLIEKLQKEEAQNMSPTGRMQLLTHNKKTDRAIILVHGYTSSPQQFHNLGQRFYDLGYNVLIAPLPHHGLADPMTTEHGKLTADELAAYADRTVDIAHGLGRQVIMMGLSAGGVTTAWAAQNRSDIDLAVIISPVFGFKKIPTPFTAAAMNIYGLLPDVFEWWDPVLKEKVLPTHGYPQYSRHALVEILRLGYAVRDEAAQKPPSANKIVLVLNDNDNRINNEMTEEMETVWMKDRANLKTYEFKAGLKLDHDLIDPAQPAQRVDIVYPRIMELVNQ
jgi:pimeloyl-ACP methyl ester carboxylesterase